MNTDFDDINIFLTGISTYSGNINDIIIVMCRLVEKGVLKILSWISSQQPPNSQVYFFMQWLEWICKGIVHMHSYISFTVSYS